MNLLIAPNAFKGSLSAEEAADCIAQGLRQSKLSCYLTLLPIADGGDGTATLLAKKIGAKLFNAKAHDPLGRVMDASFSFVENTKTAIIEMSEASGLRLLNPDELNPLIANTRGTGELIKAALDRGAQRLLLGVGGSATVDGATGLLNALGVRFLDEEGIEIVEFPSGLARLKKIDVSNLDGRIKSCEIIVLCDVQNTLLGSAGSAKTFGPQKGATENDVIILENCLEQLNKVTKETLNVEMAEWKFGGAAGGVAAGIKAFLNGKLVSGIEFFLNETGFDAGLEKADLVITGEGSLDEQTMEGKGPFGVALRAQKNNVPVIAFAGKIPLHIEKEMRNCFNAVFSIGNEPSSIKDAMQNTAANLTCISCELGNLLALKQH